MTKKTTNKTEEDERDARMKAGLVTGKRAASGRSPSFRRKRIPPEGEMNYGIAKRKDRTRRTWRKLTNDWRDSSLRGKRMALAF